jgi:Do/DeqQ family serine protease
VTLNDGRRLPTQIMGVDPEVDVAVLRVDAKGLTAVPLGDSDRLRVGDVVLAIGNPFGLGQTVTSGIVSALGRSNLGIEEYEHFIQTDASINPGNSGGALVNVEGELVGINTAIVGPSGGNIGIGFAIPISMARQIMLQLIEHGEVRRGELGVVAQDLTYDLAQAFGLQPRTGAVVVQVGSGSPAEKAGLRSGDVVVSVNGHPVHSSTQLRNAVGLLRVGTSVDLEVVREGKPRKLRAVLAEPEQEDAGRASELLAGAVVGPVQPNNPLAGRLRGLQVLSVERGSAAQAAGLRPGDVIVSVNGLAVTSPSDLEPAVQRSPGRLLMKLRRGNRGLYVVIQ